MEAAQANGLSAQEPVGNNSYPQHVKDFLLSPSVSKESISAPFKAATPLSHWLSRSYPTSFLDLS